MSATLLWHKGGTYNNTSTVSFTATSSVPPPGYICVGIAGQNEVNIASVSPSGAAYFSSPSRYHLVIWKASSAPLSGTFTVTFSSSIGRAAYSAWAVGNASKVFYRYALPKRCVLGGKALFFRWVGYIGTVGAVSCPSFTEVRADNTSSSNPKSVLFALSQDFYGTFTTDDWVRSDMYYTCSFSTSSYNYIDLWFIPPDVYAFNPRLPFQEGPHLIGFSSVAPLSLGRYLDLINTSFPMRGVIFPYAPASSEVGYAIYSRGALLSPKDASGARWASPLFMGEDWPTLTIAPGQGKVIAETEPSAILGASDVSFLVAPTLSLEPGTATHSLTEGGTSYNAYPVPIFLEALFGYPIPLMVAGGAEPSLVGRGEPLELGANGALAPRDAPKLDVGRGVWMLVPSTLPAVSVPALASSDAAHLSLVVVPSEQRISPTGAEWRLMPARPACFLGGSGGGAPSAPVAPCVIRLRWADVEVCVKDYKVFEVQEGPEGLTLRLGLEFAALEIGRAERALMRLKPGDRVGLDTVVAGGYVGVYIVEDISWAALSRAVSVDIILREVVGV